MFTTGFVSVGISFHTRLSDATKKTEKINLGQRIKKANEAWMLSSERAGIIAGRMEVSLRKPRLFP